MGAGTLGMIMSSPGQTYSVAIFIDHFIQDLGISRSLVSVLYTVGTLVGGLSLPIIGRQIDRRGPRALVVAIATLLGLSCIYMGLVQNALMLALGFIAIRMFGQGSLGLVSQNVINQWWVRRRGTVIGISGMMMALFGVGGFPNLINWLIHLFGWRYAYVFLGLLLLLVMVPVGFLFFRNEPEDYGLKPDGGNQMPGSTGPAERQPIEENWTTQEAMRTPVFWVVAAAIGVIAMLATGLIFHLVSIFRDNGLSPAIAASVFVPLSVTSAIVNLAGGVLIDRIPVRFLLAAALFFQALSLVAAQFLSGVGMVLVYGIVLGTTTGLLVTVHGVVWAKYFGRKHLGSITGITTTILIVASSLGPMPLAIAHDLLGSYNPVLTASAIPPLLLGAASLFLCRPPHKRGHEQIPVT
ncbi:MAG: MFS transporter [Ardenticatenia bacterium]|nr:MFS transporter [Ardenticatenia bacterium]